MIKSDDYVKAMPFLRELKSYRKILTVQQYRMLRGQALHGDYEAAARGLETILNNIDYNALQDGIVQSDKAFRIKKGAL